MHTDADAFNVGAIAAFAKHFCTQLVSMRYEASAAFSLADRARHILEAAKSRGFGPLSELLDRAEVRPRWNTQLALERPSFLARWIAPLVTGPTVDLLCGDGAVGHELARITGERVDLVERPVHRGTVYRSWAHQIIDLETLRYAAVKASYDTVVLCAVLHHESDPEDFLAFAARLAKRRIILVENCIEVDFPADYQHFMDLFFNGCLNSTALVSPGQHRTLEGWLELGRSFGTSYVYDRTCSVPGVPLAHSLIVIDPRAVP